MSQPSPGSSREAGLPHLALLPPMHTLMRGDVSSVMSSSAVGTVSCHSQGEASLLLLGLTPYFALPHDLRTFSLHFSDSHSAGDERVKTDVHICTLQHPEDSLSHEQPPHSLQAQD